MLPDGGIATSDPVCEPMPSKCTWTFVRCQSERECDSPQWTCLLVPEQLLIKTCFPKAIACSTDQACPAGWSCLDLSQWKDGDEPLKIWNPSEGTQFCWPDSLKPVLDRTARTDGSGLNLPTSGSDGTAASLSDAGTAAPESASKGSGCAIGGRPGAASSSSSCSPLPWASCAGARFENGNESPAPPRRIEIENPCPARAGSQISVLLTSGLSQGQSRRVRGVHRSIVEVSHSDLQATGTRPWATRPGERSSVQKSAIHGSAWWGVRRLIG